MSKRTVPYSLTGLRRATRLGDIASATLQRGLKPARNLGLPVPQAEHAARASWCRRDPSKLGANFETAWARRGPAKAARKVITNGPLRLVVHGLASPEIYGADRLEDLRLRDEPPPLIFAPTHHSHLDTPLSIISIPEPWRSKLVVAAAADFFFDTRWKGIIAALSLNAIPIDREVTGRKTSDQLKRLIEDGWSLVIYPEGGRSPDGWGQEFKGGAAYLVVAHRRCRRADVHRRLGRDLRQGHEAAQARQDQGGVRFADAARRGRVDAALQCAHRGRGHDARRRGPDRLLDLTPPTRQPGTSPKLTGPDYNGWRRQWALAEHRKLGKAGHAPPSKTPLARPRLNP